MTPSLDDVAWPVRTARLSIRPAVATDLDPTWRYRALPEVRRWLSSASADPQVYRDRFVDHDRLATMLVIGCDGVLIGDLMLRIEDGWAQVEVAEAVRGVQAKLGWCLDPAYASHGYATEAVAELLRICFDDLGLRRVSADCFAANTASTRLMERVGLRREIHSVRDALHHSGEWMDGLGYALLAEEWRAGRPVG